jgi:Zinc carboxypeptidase
MLAAWYASSGVDYAHQKLDVKYTFAIELTSGGTNGFDPPASMIQGVVDETWQGIAALVDHVLSDPASK